MRSGRAQRFSLGSREVKSSLWAPFPKRCIWCNFPRDGEINNIHRHILWIDTSVKKWILAHLLQFDGQLWRARCVCSGKMIPFYRRSILATPAAAGSVQNVLEGRVPFSFLRSFQCSPVWCCVLVHLIWTACLSFLLDCDQGFLKLYIICRCPTFFSSQIICSLFTFMLKKKKNVKKIPFRNMRQTSPLTALI